MNEDILQGQWKQLKGRVREKWGKLTNDDLDVIEGHRERLSGVLQEKYGRARHEVEREIDEFLRTP